MESTWVQEIKQRWIAQAIWSVCENILLLMKEDTIQVHIICWQTIPDDSRVCTLHRLFQSLIRIKSESDVGTVKSLPVDLSIVTTGKGTWISNTESKSRFVLVYASQLPSVELEMQQQVVNTAMDPSTSSWISIQDDTTDMPLIRFIHPPTLLAFQHTATDAIRPLVELRGQCGLALSLEIINRVISTTATSTTTKKTSHFFNQLQLSQLPLQLLLMIAKWTFYHPHILTLIAKPFTRKLSLVSQARVRHDIYQIYLRETSIWNDNNVMTPESVRVAIRAAINMRAVESQTEVPSALQSLLVRADLLEHGGTSWGRLSKCKLWDVQKNFYRELGIRAWSENIIPFGVSSSSYLAKLYARLAINFFIDVAVHNPSNSMLSMPSEGRQPNCFIWEAASGSCKFLHAFLGHFYTLFKAQQLEERYGIVPCVVATDLSVDVLESREIMPCFQAYVKDGRLDFALFDSSIFLNPTSAKSPSLYLRHSRRLWCVDNPQESVFVMGNYFFDSLRTDVFIVTQNGDCDVAELREAVIEMETLSVADMSFRLKKVHAHPRHTPIYEDVQLNQALDDILDRLQAVWASSPYTPHSSLVLFPVEAMKFLSTLFYTRQSLGGPLAVIIGDATFNAFDGIPSAFLAQDPTADSGMEIPQLSPDPHCFCLPIDVDILQTFVIQQLSGSASVSVAPASDTFNLLYATTSANSRGLNTFHQMVESFTPSDCDLLWGLMGLDHGAKHLSFNVQMLLLAQTAWDFDLFLVVQWPLFHQLKTKVRACHDSEVQSGTKARADQIRQLESMRRRLIDAGQRSLQTMYVMDESTELGQVNKMRMIIQIARWFYGLHAFQEVISLLEPLSHANSDNLPRFYLLGRVYFRVERYWDALVCFRKCLHLNPQKKRFEKWSARTLHCLQQLQQSQTRGN